jgi:hypothetical protein
VIDSESSSEEDKSQSSQEVSKSSPVDDDLYFMEGEVNENSCSLVN